MGIAKNEEEKANSLYKRAVPRQRETTFDRTPLVKKLKEYYDWEFDTLTPDWD